MVHTRYNLYVDCMPTDDITPLTVETVNRIIGFALNSRLLKEKLMDTTQHINEINIQYARTMNKIIFDHSICKGGVQEGIAMIPFNTGDLPEVVEKDTVFSERKIDLPQYEFLNHFSEFSFRTLLTKQEVVVAITKVRLECQKVLKMNMFNMHFAKSMKLDEFEQNQLQAGDQVYQFRGCIITRFAPHIALYFLLSQKSTYWVIEPETNHPMHV